MNRYIHALFVLLFISCSNPAFSQLSGQDDYNNLKSVAETPAGFKSMPNFFTDDPVTIDGFDNFYLGVDFGEPHIVTNPNDPLNSICAFNTNGVYYTLNGVDWNSVAVGFPGYAVLGDPVLAFDSLGVCHYIQIFQNGSTYGLVTTKSTNKGQSWSGVSAVVSTTVGLTDKEWIIADRTAGPNSNNLYVGWRQFGSSSGMRFVRSTNGGATWSSPLSFFDGSQGAYVGYGPNGSTPGGKVYFAYTGGSSNYVRISTDAGVSFGGPINATGPFTSAGIVCSGRFTVKNCIRTNAFPKISVDNSYGPHRGNVYMVYEINPSGVDIADVYLARSTNGGNNWLTPVRINDDATTTDQWLPAIDVDDKTGKVFISWFDSREDPANNLQTKVYGTVSTDGGATFTTNESISNASFNPNDMAVGQGGGQARYIGDYFGISAIGNTSYAVWMDGRNNNLGSYVGYYPDFAMTVNTKVMNIGNSETKNVTITSPDTKGPFGDRVKFNAVLENSPASGSISFSFANGKDSITSFPDSVIMNVTTSGSVTPGRYEVSIYGRGSNGTPVHKRGLSVLVNSSLLKIGTNRSGIITYTVNGNSYNNQQELVFANGSNVTVSAPYSLETGSNNYVFTGWSNGGDTTQSITINNNLDLTASYKVQYKFLMISSQGNIFGGNTFYDSAVSFTFGVTTKTVVSGGNTYYFRGWNGGGPGSYTSSDSSGSDSVVSIAISNPVVESVRWSLNPVSVQNISSEIPDKYELYQNYPNPFNPETRIRFDIIKTGNVEVIVYDVLGKEVELLVNQVQQPGKYEVNFDASRLSSGIYYYKIVTSDFVQVKKMLLIK